MIGRLNKLNINSVYQLAVQNPIQLVTEFEDTSITIESAAVLIANARKILIENGVLSKEFLTADSLLEKRNKLSRYATGSESFDDSLYLQALCSFVRHANDRFMLLISYLPFKWIVTSGLILPFRTTHS
jgi:hypothetical protein